MNIMSLDFPYTSPTTRKVMIHRALEGQTPLRVTKLLKVQTSKVVPKVS
jgi:hypothetical protein